MSLRSGDWKRYGFTLAALRKMDPAACSDDPRLLYRTEDGCRVYVRDCLGDHSFLVIHSSRQLRLLGKQFLAYADYLENPGYSFEVVP